MDGDFNVVRFPFECGGVYVKDRIKKMWKDLSVLENMEESKGILADETVEVGRIRDELEKATLLEEICWRQKSRVLYVRKGDKNIKFFHRIVNSHSDRLMVGGELSSNLAAIASVSLSSIGSFILRMWLIDLS